MASQKCFAKGSAGPGPVAQGSVRLYSMRFCPFAQRARLVLNAKGIRHDIVNINISDKPEWFLEKNPLGLVPTLETPAGEVIYESPITCDYLDEVYPERKLLPSSPYARAQQKMLLEQFSKVIPYFYKIPAAENKGEDVSAMKAELKEKFARLNQELVRKESTFFGGNSITMIDYMLWPFFERLDVFNLRHCLDETAELMRWTELMSEDPAVKATRHSVDTYKGFYKTYAEGKADFDYGL